MPRTIRAAAVGGALALLLSGLSPAAPAQVVSAHGDGARASQAGRDGDDSPSGGRRCEPPLCEGTSDFIWQIG